VVPGLGLLVCAVSGLSQGDFELVVMATHGRGGAARLMMGSVADKVVRSAPCPVLTIRAAGERGEHGHRAA
jgi:nucleotide-binding universal stress UspA family protein